MSKRSTAIREAQPDLLGDKPAADPHPSKTKAATKPVTKVINPASTKAQPLAVVEKRPPTVSEVGAMLYKISENPKSDPAVARAYAELYKDMEAYQARKEFAAAFVALQADLSKVRITKDRRIEIEAKPGKRGQSTPYATFENIYTAVMPLLQRHGFGLSFQTEPSPDGTRINVIGILERGGHQRTTTFPLPAEVSGSKNNVQGWGSSFAYGKRYATIALLNIVSFAPEDTDTDGNPLREDEPKVTDEQAVELVDAIEAAGVTRKKFCEKYKIDKVGDLPASLFKDAMTACRDHKARKGSDRE